MKKLFLLIAILSIGLSLFAASPVIQLADKESEVAVYDGNGSLLDKNNIGVGDYVRAKGESAKLETELADMTLYGDTLFAITDLDKEPSLYIVFGKAELTLNCALASPLTVLTPTTSYELTGKGSYLITTNDQEELFENHSSANVNAYDSIRGRNYTMQPEQLLDVKMAEVTGIAAEPAAEPAAEAPQAEPVQVIESLVDSVVADQASDQVDMALIKTVPDAPTFASLSTYLQKTPSKPTVYLTEESLKKDLPSSPVFKGVSQELVIKNPEKPAFLMVVRSIQDADSAENTSENKEEDKAKKSLQEPIDKSQQQILLQRKQMLAKEEILQMHTSTAAFLSTIRKQESQLSR